MHAAAVAQLANRERTFEHVDDQAVEEAEPGLAFANILKSIPK